MENNFEVSILVAVVLFFMLWVVNKLRDINRDVTAKKFGALNVLIRSGSNWRLVERFEGFGDRGDSAGTFVGEDHTESSDDVVSGVSYNLWLLGSNLNIGTAGCLLTFLGEFTQGPFFSGTVELPDRLHHLSEGLVLDEGRDVRVVLEEIVFGDDAVSSGLLKGLEELEEDDVSGFTLGDDIGVVVEDEAASNIPTVNHTIIVSINSVEDLRHDALAFC